MSDTLLKEYRERVSQLQRECRILEHIAQLPSNVFSDTMKCTLTKSALDAFSEATTSSPTTRGARKRARDQRSESTDGHGATSSEEDDDNSDTTAVDAADVSAASHNNSSSGAAGTKARCVSRISPRPTRAGASRSYVATWGGLKFKRPCSRVCEWCNKYYERVDVHQKHCKKHASLGTARASASRASHEV